MGRGGTSSSVGESTFSLETWVKLRPPPPTLHGCTVQGVASKKDQLRVLAAKALRRAQAELGYDLDQAEFEDDEREQIEQRATEIMDEALTASDGDWISKIQIPDLEPKLDPEGIFAVLDEHVDTATKKFAFV